MLILSNEEIEKILPVTSCLQVLEEAYRDLGNGAAATVPRYDVFSPIGDKEFYEYKTMSGVLPNRRIAALRLNSSVVKWYEKAGGLRKDKLPVAGGDRYVGLVMLFSTETGEPLAIFPDGYVQKLRVAGASAIAARYLARKDSEVMALLGAGWQAGFARQGGKADRRPARARRCPIIVRRSRPRHQLAAGYRADQRTSSPCDNLGRSGPA